MVKNFARSLRAYSTAPPSLISCLRQYKVHKNYVCVCVRERDRERERERETGAGEGKGERVE